jgi:hypothetical protein
VRQLVIGLFGDDQFANVFLVGAGFQTGALPLPPDAIEEALRVNGVAVEKNIQAFRRGRQYIADPAAVLSAAFRVLRAMHRVRGTWMDPFGRTQVRVVERELIEEYIGLVDQLAGGLNPASAALAVRLAELPDVVRGYEDVKLRNVESYHQSLAELRAQLDASAVSPA